MKKKFIHSTYCGTGKPIQRAVVAEHSKKANCTLGFYGGGESHNLALKNGVNIISIENGKNYSKREFKNFEELTRKHNNLINTSLKNFCETEKDRKIGCFDLDYCGTLNPSTKEDLTLIGKVSERKGTIWITLLRAREDVLPKGATREEINAEIKRLIIEHLKIGKLEATCIYMCQYLGGKSINGEEPVRHTPMIMWGFSFIKTY